ncbi:MAG: TAT-variant-translocated molybdopterin oxidoreductase [Planctomycetota bacterium]|jgi:molybdopterin-containing oxidoreductase family iron-sulfur binding subunit
MTTTDPIVPAGERRYWRSLDQLEDTPEFRELLHREFPEGITEPPQDPVSRRRFLGVVAAAVAMAGLTSRRKPERRILPYAKRPEDTLPGVAEHYATSQVHDGYGVGVVMKSTDGRPVKVEGNKLHPMSLGGTSQHMQAEVLSLYDPARSRHPIDHRPHEHGDDHDHDDHGDEAAAPTFVEFETFWANQRRQLKINQGKGLALLMAPTTSPSTLAMVARFKKTFPKATVHTWAAVNQDDAVAGTTLAFGHAMNPQYDLEQARVIVGFDSDHMACGSHALDIARQIAKARSLKDENDTLPRLYAIESYYTLTGASADHRFRVRAHEVGDTVMALAHELSTNHGVNMAGIDAPAAKDRSWEYNGKDWIPILAKDLVQNRGKSCLICGPNQPPVVQAMVHALNAALGNAGKTVSYTPTPAGMARIHGDTLDQLATAMGKGGVQTLVMLGTNPVYDAPADLEFGRKLENVETTVHVGLFEDETGAKCTWHVNQAHDLEAWGDIRAYDGTLSFVQPLIAPLFGGKSILEMLAVLIGGDTVNGYDLVRQHWQLQRAGGSNFEQWWARCLHDGVVPKSAAGTVPGGLRWSDVRDAVQKHKPAPVASKDSLEVSFRADYTLHDGRYSNNAWLQELPDPMHKLTWDNAALMSRRTAEDLGVWNEDVVKFTLEGREVEAPVWILPGHADNSVTFHLGYGRELGDEFQVAKGAGFSAYKLRSSSGMHMAAGMTARKTGRSYQLVTTQNQGTMEGRALVRENTLEGYKKDPEFAPNMSPLKDKSLNRSLWGTDELPESHQYKQGYQWGMVIDLNACTGCNACVVACQAENNIPTVGKDQVAVGRAMHWNRLDRYFTTDNSAERSVQGVPPRREVPKAENPPAVHMMVPCQQCEKAPCEVVCPVAATTHSPEGLNDMVYNRCVGTRYCSNNCPFKVRRFNYLDYQGETPETKKMAHNPDVTVRVRGVMEKCTYCVHRINRGKLEAKLEKRDLADGEIVTACAQACPTQAITFGDINNENTKVHQLKQSNRNYAMLSELNIWPRTTYLAKVRNPNPELGWEAQR